VRRLLRHFWGVLLLLALWQIWVELAGYNVIVMPRPIAVFGDLARHPLVYVKPALATLAVAFGGLVGGIALSLALAIVGWLSGLLRGLVIPVAVMFSAIPVVAIIPILARLFGYHQSTVLVVVMIITFFPSFVFGSAGLRALPPLSEDLFRVLGASRWTVLERLALPAAVPHLMIAMRLAAAHSVLAAMVAEFLMGTSGLGELFATTRADFKMDRAIGASLVAMAMSVTIYLAASAAERRVRERWS
jgi:ABC-type nitrate/sulfonate/bicarbonate transport system permease component